MADLTNTPAPAPASIETPAPAAPEAPVTTGQDAAPSPKAFAEIDRILSFDPFPDSNVTELDRSAPPAAPAPTPIPTPSEQVAVPPMGGPQPVPIAPAPGPQPVSPSPAAPVNPELERLRAVAAQLRGTLPAPAPVPQAPAPVAQPVAVQPQPGAPQPGGQDELVRNYSFDIPDQLVTVLASDVPAERKEGLKALIAGVGAAIHHRVMQAVQQSQTSLQQDMPQRVQAMIQQNHQALAIAQDFYGSYPSLNDPALHQVVVGVAGRLNQELGVAPPWSADYRDEIAKRVHEVLGRQFQKAGAQPQHQVAPTPTGTPIPLAGPARIVGLGGSRPPTAGAPDAQQADILDTLFGTG